MLEFANLPAPPPKRTIKDKESTKARLEKELWEDLAATNGTARIYFPPGRKGNSKNPNEVIMFDFVDDGFLNRTAHEEAVAIIEAWKPAPWKGQIWKAQRHIDRVWTGPTHHDLQWNGAEWVIYDAPLPSHSAQDGAGATDTILDLPCRPEASGEFACAQEDEEESDTDKPKDVVAEDKLNAAYLEYEADPVGQRDSWFVTLSEFVRTTKRVSQISWKSNNLPEIYMDLEDIFSEFVINLIHRIETEQYTHRGKIHKWIGYIWGNFFFPEIETKIFGYVARNTYVNNSDPDSKDYEFQNHAVGLLEVEEQQAKREEGGYAVPISRDKIFRQLSKPVQNIVQMLCEGMTQDEIAVNLGISPRQLRRRLLDKTAKDASNVVCIDACADYGGYVVGSIQACADEPTNSIADRIEEYEHAITAIQLAKILQCSRREIYKLVDQGRLPALRLGTMIRLDPAQVAAWVRSKMTIAA